MRLKMIDQYRGLPGPVYVLMIARLIIATGTFVFPFLTMFLSSRIGMNDQEISRYLLLVAVAQLPANMIGGKLADRFPRKRVYGVAMFLSASFFAFSGFCCQQVWVVWTILAGYFFSNMSHPVLSAMIMDITEPQNRQESFSLVYLGFNMGYAIGPFIAGLLFENHTPWIFWGQAILVSTAVSLVLLKMPLHGGKRLGQEEAPATKQASLWSLLKHDPVILIFAACLVCYAFAYSQISYLTPLDLEQSQGISIASKTVSLIWSLNGVVVFLCSPLLILLTKKNASIVNCALGGLFYLLGFGGMAFCNGQRLPVLCLVLVWTAGEILCNTNSGVFIANHAPASHRARYQSIYDIIQNLGKAAGPFLMGFFLLRYNYSQAWLFVALLCLLAAGGLLLLQRRLKAQE